jgi:hypothetical protein
MCDCQLVVRCSGKQPWFRMRDSKRHACKGAVTPTCPSTQPSTSRLQAYSMNHPAGRIGKRLMLTVRSVMLSGNMVPLVEDQPVLAALSTLTAKGCGCLLVVAPGDASKLLGVFTDGDLRRAVQVCRAVLS